MRALRILICLLSGMLLGACMATPASAPLVSATTPDDHAKRIALTFDDVPRGLGAFFTADERTARIIAGLEKAGVRQAAFFLNPGHLANPEGQGGEARIAAYVAAGHVIANHTSTHPDLSDSSVEAYLADLDAAETWLHARPGRRPWFRFPFLDEGRSDKVKRDAVRGALAARGLRNGYATVDASDWHLEALTHDAKAAGKAIDMTALERLYVRSHVESAEFADALAVRALGRSPVHVVVMHETDLAALFLPALVAALEAEGWTLVTADEAYADPIADLSATVDAPSAQGTLLEAVAAERGIVGPHWWPGNDMATAKARFDREVLR